MTSDSDGCHVDYLKKKSVISFLTIESDSHFFFNIEYLLNLPGFTTWIHLGSLEFTWAHLV